MPIVLNDVYPFWEGTLVPLKYNILFVIDLLFVYEAEYSCCATQLIKASGEAQLLWLAMMLFKKEVNWASQILLLVPLLQLYRIQLTKVAYRITELVETVYAACRVRNVLNLHLIN